MSFLKVHPPVKLTIGFIFKDNNTLKRAVDILEKKFGKADFESNILPFIHTIYYEKEFGKDLKRKFISFKKLILPQKLSEIKNFTKRVEKKLSLGTRRQINIDPGYLGLAKLVLATTKDYKHRIYIGAGIYAEITLFYQNNTFTPWDWTYPDYRSAEYISIFNRIRQVYAEQIKNK